MSVNNRVSKYKLTKEKDTARTICICIAVISFALLILVAALPSMYEKYNENAEKEEISSLEYNSKNINEDIAASLSAKKSTDNVELPEIVLDDIHANASQDSIERKAVPGPDGPLPLVYTIQAGSFNDMDSAWKLYDSIMNKLYQKDLAYLRIEKVGQYYAVRIGKFKERSHVEIFHENIKSQLATAMIMQAYIKEERVKKLHSS